MTKKIEDFGDARSAGRDSAETQHRRDDLEL